MVARLGLRFAQQTGIDREWVFAVVAETMSEAERAFGSKTEGALLERYALEAAIDLLSHPTKALDFLPELAPREDRQAQIAR